MTDESGQSPLRTKSYAFALEIVKLSRQLTREEKEYVLARQILRSGTSVGANILEATQGQSRADFIHKLSISLKEAVETNYWLQLLRDSDMITQSRATELLDNCRELEKMLTASIKTAKNNRS
jgi:four helix bundle protein